jgi:hypothetical protein
VPVVTRDLAFLNLPAYVEVFFWLNGILYYLFAGALAIFSGVQYFVRYVPHLKGTPSQGR